MNKMLVAQRIVACGLIPIVRFDRFEDVHPLVDALYAGGIDIVEFSLTSPAALRAIEQTADRYGDTIALGAGTVLDTETARSCFLAGAQFLVSPAVNEAVIAMSNRYSRVICPGALTPTEVLHAWTSGADFVKVFPCGNVGGPAYIRSLKTPYPHIAMIPVGGVTIDNAADFIAAGSCALGASGMLIDRNDASPSRYDAITQRAARLLSVIRNARNDILE